MNLWLSNKAVNPVIGSKDMTIQHHSIVTCRGNVLAMVLNRFNEVLYNLHLQVTVL